MRNLRVPASFKGYIKHSEASDQLNSSLAVWSRHHAVFSPSSDELDVLLHIALHDRRFRMEDPEAPMIHSVVRECGKLGIKITTPERFLAAVGLARRRPRSPALSAGLPTCTPASLAPPVPRWVAGDSESAAPRMPYDRR